MTNLESRMKNPVLIVSDAMQSLFALSASIKTCGVDQRTLELVNLRASQINGCSFCVDMHARDLKKAGETDQRLFSLAAWREAPWFNAAERAALALTEASTRISDQAEPVSDSVWEEARRHYDEQALAGLILNIAQINFWNRVNVPIRQVAGVAFS